MASETFTFEVGKEATLIEVKSWEELIEWVEKERANWDWLRRGGETDLPNQLGSSTQTLWDQLLQALRQYQAEGRALPYAENALYVLKADGPLLVSLSADGTQILDIRKTAGDVGAAFAYSFIKGQADWARIKRPDALLGTLLTVWPDMANPAETAAELKLERKRFGDSLRSGLTKVRNDFDKQQKDFDALVRRGKNVSLLTLRKRTEEWKEQQVRLGAQSLEAIAEINAVKDAYLQFMQLQAPVEYWTTKSTVHKDAASWAAFRLTFYFIMLTIVLAVVFFRTGSFLIDHTPATGTNPIALYVVVSGGLVVLSTVGFWIGRLLTKLYLSEHHLRTDAEERAIMTKTYLALTKESAASDADRQIILAALFRAAPDGIVKDDGPPDIGLQAMLAKAMARP